MSSVVESILNATIFRLFYHLERGLCWIIDILYHMFEVFAGLVKVEYNGSTDYLINIFFSNRAVSNIYWGMALIGIALTFGFAIAAVVKKMFDASGKVQQSLGQIIWGGLRSIIIILGMTAIMSVVLNGTGVLMQQVSYLFQDPYNLHLPEERTYTGEEYAAMARVLSTIGNYSAVDSTENRYNMNLCYNDIRPDMYYLQQQGVFEYSYYSTDKNGNVEKTWQSVLAQIASSCDLSKDVKVDQYNDGVSRSLKNAMAYLRTTANPRALPSITRKAFEDSEAHLDRMVFLMGTFRAAKNPAYNKTPAFDDALRGRYYYGEDRSIYDLDHVDSDFNIGFATDYIVVWVAAIAIIFDLLIIILNCIARIFNMLFLYLIAPPVIAAQPLDNGAKTKQWMTAFLVQSLSVFGTVIAMRLLLLFLPLIVSPQLVLFENSAILNALAKLVLIYGGFEAAKKSSSILTGILADSAGWQAVQAGDMSNSAAKVMGAARQVGGKAWGAASFVAAPLTNRLASPFQRAANAWRNSGSAKYDIQASEEQKMHEVRKSYKDKEDQKRLSGGSGGSSGSGSGSGSGGGKSNNPTPALSRPIPTPPSSSNPGSGHSSNQNIQNSQNHQSNLNHQNNQNPQNLNQPPVDPGRNNPPPAQPGNNHQPPGNPVNNQQPQPGNPVINQQPQPRNPVINQQPQPGNPVINQQPQPGNPGINQQPQPGNPVINQQPQPGNPVINQQPQQGNPVNNQQPQPGNPGNNQQPQPGNHQPPHRLANRPPVIPQNLQNPQNLNH